jgi:solute carrier family 30 (zinc transporter), member 9
VASGTAKVVISAIAGNLFITIIKFIGWFITRSPSMMAESVHSLADTLNQILLLVGLKQSEGPHDPLYPVGTGGARYLWNLISAVGIFFLGFGVTFYHGLHSLLKGDHIAPEINYWVIGILLLSAGIEFYVFLQAYREIKSEMGSRSFIQHFYESDNPTSVAILLEDGVAVLGVLLALGGIVLGHIFQSPYFDIITSIVISILLGVMAVLLALVNGKLLIGRRVKQDDEEEMKKFIEALPEVEKVIQLSTVILGANEARLTVEVELLGENLIDYKALQHDANSIKEGEDAYKVLVGASERMVRISGRVVNQMENKILEKFPSLSLIDFIID